MGAWLALASGGLVALAARGAGAGPPAAAPRELAPGPELALRRSGRATLVVVAHPACPCTRATFNELERALGSVARARSEAASADLLVLFVGPRDGEARKDRVAAELRARAEAIPGARVLQDPGGVEAARLGARTSGTVLFYDHAGKLRFNGGITPARGHEGGSAAGDVLRTLLLEEPIPRAPDAPVGTSEAPVFGCALAAESSHP